LDDWTTTTFVQALQQLAQSQKDLVQVKLEELKVKVAMRLIDLQYHAGHNYLLKLLADKNT